MDILGGVSGTPAFEQLFLRRKMDGWIDDLCPIRFRQPPHHYIDLYLNLKFLISLYLFFTVLYHYYDWHTVLEERVLPEIYFLLNACPNYQLLKYQSGHYASIFSYVQPVTQCEEHYEKDLCIQSSHNG